MEPAFQWDHDGGLLDTWEGHYLFCLSRYRMIESYGHVTLAQFMEDTPWFVHLDFLCRILVLVGTTG